MKYIAAFLLLFGFAAPAFAVGVTIVTALSSAAFAATATAAEPILDLGVEFPSQSL